jgi:predicted MPP superfamily phosphohydrolase
MKITLEVVLVFSALFGVVILLSFLVGLHGRIFLKAAGLGVPAWIYWPLFWLIACSYILSRWFSGPASENFLSLLGSYWLGALAYFLLGVLLYDLILLLNRFFKFIPPGSARTRFTVASGICVLSAVSLLLVYGSWRARTPVVTEYEVTTEKPLPQKELRIALVADIHLGGLIRKKGLAQMVGMVNGLKADVILLAGDILDRGMGIYTEESLGEEFRRLTAPLGVFAVPGNHEYFGESVPEFQKLLAQDGVRMFIDEYLTLPAGFTLIGRNDRRGGERKTIPELLAEIPEEGKKVPLILMDHQPYNLENAEAAGIDLMVSGHTHKGQFWPITMITKAIYEIDYGLLQKGATTIIVTSGYGLWGPPLRIGSVPEIVCITLRSRYGR